MAWSVAAPGMPEVPADPPLGPAAAGQPRQLTAGPLRRMLEGCALSDVSRVLPDLVRVIAHASHTTASLARAWREFSDAIQDAYALNAGTRRWADFFERADLGSCPDVEALEIKLSQAERAWRLITSGAG